MGQGGGMDRSVKKSKSTKEVADTLLTLFYAFVIAFLIRTFAYEPFSIPSGSMLPTLLVGDYVFVSKYSYGYSRYSMPWGLPPFEGRVMETLPERGDVAVFKLPADNETDYIKRIIGLPGDTVQVTRGVLRVNGERVKRRAASEETISEPGGVTDTVTQYVEVLPDGREHLIWERSDTDFFDDTRVFRVPDGHVFAMGDNRDSSQDSRSPQVGFIPIQNLVGRAEIIFFSFDSRDPSDSAWHLWKWGELVRFGRLFDRIE
jgi:signal peptidase I